MHLVIEDRRRRTLRINSNARLGDIVSLDRGSGARRQIEAVTPGDLVARDHIGLVAVNADPRSLGGDLNRRDGIVQSMARHLNRRSQTGELVIGDGVAGRAVRNQDSRMQRAERIFADDVVRRVAEESDAGSAAGETQVVKQVAAGVVQEQRGTHGGQRRASGGAGEDSAAVRRVEDGRAGNGAGINHHDVVGRELDVRIAQEPLKSGLGSAETAPVVGIVARSEAIETIVGRIGHVRIVDIINMRGTIRRGLDGQVVFHFVSATGNVNVITARGKILQGYRLDVLVTSARP